jgi:hypothetical protein
MILAIVPPLGSPPCIPLIASVAYPVDGALNGDEQVVYFLAEDEHSCTLLVVAGGEFRVLHPR